MITSMGTRFVLPFFSGTFFNDNGETVATTYSLNEGESGMGISKGDINSININLNACKIIIEPAEGSGLVDVEYTGDKRLKPDVTFENGKLTAKNNASGGLNIGFNINKPVLTIKLGKETKIDNLEIKVNAGDISINGVYADYFFGDFDAGNINTKQLLNFAHIHYKINARDKIKYENKGNSSFETFAYKDASTTVGRYFGIGLSEDELKKLPAPAAGEQGPFYENGKIWYPTADGENYNLIAVVDSATSNSDGTFTFNFTVYSIDWNTYSNFKEGDIKKYYKLTSAKAASDKTLTKATSGTAKVGVGQSGNYFLLVYNTVK